MTDQPVSEDVVLVPREPTEAMLDAGDAPFHAELRKQRLANEKAGRPLNAFGSGPVSEAIYRAMLAAAPAALTQTSPAAGEGVREKVARLIDPLAFKSWQGLYEFCIPTEGEETARSFADRTHGPDVEAAYAKADAILAALASPPVSEAVRPAKQARKSLSCFTPWCGGGQLCIHCDPTPQHEGDRS